MVHEVEARHPEPPAGRRPDNDPFRVRVVTREKFGMQGTRTVAMDAVRDHVAEDLAADIRELLASDATYDGRPIGPATSR